MIYLDNAATTPLSQNAKLAMEKYWSDSFGNPSSLYLLGKENKKVLSNCRAKIAKCINSNPEEIYFTSCGSESDNWALKGVAYKNQHKGKHIIVSTIEHHAILNTCNFLAKQGFEITYLPVTETGEVEEKELEKAIRPDTILISIMMVNNELGTIQNIQQLCNIAHSKNIIFHTDAVQAIGHLPIDVKLLNVDLLSCSAHKFNGPKGVGFLFIKNGTSFEPLIHGGQQENHSRAGTENIPLIVGMTVALEEHTQNLDRNNFYISSLRNHLLDNLSKTNLDYIINGSKNTIPGTISISFKDGEGESILYRLDLMGIYISTGSACDSVNTELSHVLKAIKCNEEYAFGTIRISISENNTLEDMDILSESLKKILSK